MTTRKDIRIHGPMWQFECTRCHYTQEDICDYKYEAEAAAKEHDCLSESPRFNFDGEEGGVLYVTHMGTRQQYQLIPVDEETV